MLKLLSARRTRVTPERQIGRTNADDIGSPLVRNGHRWMNDKKIPRPQAAGFNLPHLTSLMAVPD